MIVSWFSAGVSSAVATKLANPDKIIYIDIEDQHPDTYRFISDCQAWFGKEIEVLRSPYKNVENTCIATSYIRGPATAVCTDRLKRRPRKEWEYAHPGRHTYVWGFDGHERERVERTVKAMPEFDHVFPLLGMLKSEVHGMIEEAGIKRPEMYDLGYPNNNCIGCLKGGMGYWNKIRVDFPAVFTKRAAMERKIGNHILKECFLDELNPHRGRDLEIIVPDCGIFCGLEFARPAQKEAVEQHTTAASRD